MNRTKIEWCDRTWNPVSGCLHSCNFCYARRIANRFGTLESNSGDMPDSVVEVLTEKDGIIAELNERLPGEPYPYNFVPTFHKYRLDDPQKVKKSQRVFVCSMADLFGEWVPDEWIKDVFEACMKAPQHKYLFLTKNPGRYTELADKRLLPEFENMWFGSTITTPKDTFWRSMRYNSFLSIEPIFEPFGRPENPSQYTKWVIVGAETGNRKGKVIPKREWIEDIVATCRETDTPVFMKDSLKELMGDDFVQEWPEGLK